MSGAVAPFSFELIAGGHSNLTYRVVGADGHPLVLRRPPLGHLLASAHDMGREHRIIAALADTPVPVAPARGLLRRRRRVRRAVLRHGLRRRPRHPRPRGRRGGADARSARPTAGRAPRRHAGRHPCRRHRGGRSLRPRSPRGLHRPPAQAVVRAVAAVADPAAADGRRGARPPQLADPRAGTGVHRARRLPARQHDGRRQRARHRRARLGDLHPRRPHGRRRHADGVLDGTGRRGFRLDRAPRRRRRASPTARSSSPATPACPGATSAASTSTSRFAFWKLACILEGVYARYLAGALGGGRDPSEHDAFRQQVEQAADQAALHAARL